MGLHFGIENEDEFLKPLVGQAKKLRSCDAPREALQIIPSMARQSYGAEALQPHAVVERWADFVLEAGGTGKEESGTRSHENPANPGNQMLEPNLEKS